MTEEKVSFPTLLFPLVEVVGSIVEIYLITQASTTQ